MLQDWRDLLFLHWRVEPARLQRLVPPSLEVETFDGSSWVGLVPFRVERVRPPLVPRVAAAPARFGEVNVRTYARPRRGGPPGVWFMSLDAGSALAVFGARATYRLPYFSAITHFHRDRDHMRFRSERRGDAGACDIEWSPCGPDAVPAPPRSLEEFLIERYVLYSEDDGRLLRADVAHRSYPLRAASLLRLEQDLVERAGVEVSGAPLVHYSPGVDVRISLPRRFGPTVRGAAPAAGTAH